MKENKMEEVAKLLGVELGEEFKMDKGHIIYMLSNSGLVYRDNNRYKWNHSDMLEHLLLGDYKITKMILNCIEKEYLSNVIKPFKNRVIYIAKHDCTLGEYLEICLRHYDDECCSYSIALPDFKKGTMYNGMELGKEYTLYELGL